MTLREKIERNKFVITCEISPPKGIDVGEALENAKNLSQTVDAFNITDSQGATMRLGSMALCHLMAEHEFETVYQLTCRDRNSLALQSDLLSAWALGLENVLALTGDHTKSGDHPEAAAVFEFDSIQLLHTISTLNEGCDLAGNSLTGRPNFYPGAALNPGAHPQEPQIEKAKRKVKEGAMFFQTQPVYNPTQFANFMKKLREEGVNQPVLAGILPLKSTSMARYMNENVSGITVPKDVIKELDAAVDLIEVSMEITERIIGQIKRYVQGVHIMPIGLEENIIDLTRKVKS